MMDLSVFRISNAGACPRRLQLMAWGVQGAPVWEGTRRAFAEGHLHEQSILDWAAMNLPGGPYRITAAQMEVRVGDLTGHIDALMVNAAGIVLAEAKTLAARAFRSLREKGVRESHPQYYDQVQLYMHGLQGIGMDVRRAFLVARNKETPKNRLWDHHFQGVQYDRDYAMAKAEELHRLIDLTVHGQEVQPPYNPRENWQCRPPWCEYTATCHPDWHRQQPEARDTADLARVVAEYLEIREARAELERAEKELAERLKAAATAGPVRAGAWIVELVERTRETVNAQAVRSMLGPEDLAAVLRVSTYKVLEIREVGQ